jgi:hypothetical protein
MNLTEGLMNLTGLETLLIVAQACLLLSCLLIFLSLRKRISPGWARRTRNPGGRNHLPVDLARFQELLRETEALSRELSRNLEEKKEITRRLLERLDGKTAHLETLMRQALAKENSRPQQAPEEENPGSILELSRAGFGVPDIARRLGRSKEEIQLVLDVTQLTPNFPNG